MAFSLKRPPTARGRRLDIQTLSVVLGKSGCAACPLDHAPLQHPKIPPTGAKRCDVYLLGEAPGAEEDERNEQFVGKSGQYLRQHIPADVAVRWNNTLRCFAGDVRVVSPRAIRKGFRRQFSGVLVTVKTRSGRILSGTQNHPLLTTQGWIPLARIAKGDQLLCTSIRNRKGTIACPDKDYVPIPISKIFDLLGASAITQRMIGTRLDFHGDGRNGKVDIVIPDRELWHKGDSLLLQDAVKDTLVIRDHLSRTLERFSSRISMRGEIGFGSASSRAGIQSSLSEPFADCLVGDPELGDASSEVVSSEIELDDVVDLSLSSFDGHVYTLETDDGWFTANGIIVANCRPPKNRAPSTLELSCCRKQNEQDIETSRPKLIVAVGSVPLHWLTQQDKITAWRGRLIPVRVGRHACWCMPILHPAYVLRLRNQKNSDAMEAVFSADLERAFRIVDDLEPPTLEDPTHADDGLVYCTTERLVHEALESIARWNTCALDLETKGLRPYNQDSKILSVALSNFDQTYCIPLHHKETPFKPEQRERIQKWLLQEIIGKRVIAHNSKFEIEWLAHAAGPRMVHDVDWQDTLSQAYVLDEREGAKSLEALSIIHLGMDVKALNTLNVARLDDEPIAKVLRYNGHDAKYTYPLYFIQHDLLKREKLLDVYQMHNQRVGPLAYAQVLGMHPDTRLAAQLAAHYEERIKQIDATIQSDRDVLRFKEKQREFNPASPKQLKEFFHDQLGFKQLLRDDGGDDERFSTDEAVLSTVKHSVAQLIIDRRELSKLHGTYIVPMMAGGKNIHDDGLVHTNFNHARTATSRTSSDEPNLQNIPIRTVEGKTIRRAFVAPKGCWFVSFDYGQIEARVIGMASRDRFLCDALWTGYDVHQEWAEKIARRAGMKLDKPGLKQFRQTVKNKWTFPLYFGASLKSVCGYLELEQRTLGPLYEEFWDAFADVRSWQRTLTRFYKEHGYVQFLTGRRRRAPMSYNEVLNTPVQGTASEIVVAASVDLSKRAYLEQKPHWQFRLNVHDDLGFYLPDATLEQDIEAIARVMCQPRFNFINVPLTCEVKVGRNWGEQEEIAVFSSEQWGHKRTDV